METNTRLIEGENSIENEIGEKGSVQVKLFTRGSSRTQETEANRFLAQNKDRIKVRDIKYSEHPDPKGERVNGSLSRFSSLMIIYDVL